MGAATEAMAENPIAKQRSNSGDPGKERMDDFFMRDDDGRVSRFPNGEG
jgi:hypothetical protein